MPMKSQWLLTILTIPLLVFGACAQEQSMESEELSSQAVQEETSESTSSPPGTEPEGSVSEAPVSKKTTASSKPADRRATVETKTAVEEPSTPQVVEVPAGTNIRLRLDHAVSSQENQSGETFRAHIDEPVRVNDEVVIPAGAALTGVLTEVKDSGRVKGRARMTMTLQSLTFDGKEYALKTEPLAFEAEGTKKEDAKKIGIGAAIGAAVGAIAGGGDGAAKGAAIGAGAGTGVVLATKGEHVEFPAETAFVFTLSEPIELPVSQ